MGTLILTNFQTDLRFMLDNRTDLTTTQLNRWINAAYDHVCRPNIYRHRELQLTQSITLATGDRDYALDSRVDFIYTVYNDTEDYGLLPRDIRQFDRSRISTKQPRFYDTWGTDLVLDSLPDTGSVGDVLVVRYWATRTALTGTNATAIHERWDEIILEGAAWRGWKALQSIDRANEHRDNFARLINEVPPIQRIEGEDWGQSSEPQIIPYQRVS